MFCQLSICNSTGVTIFSGFKADLSRSLLFSDQGKEGCESGMNTFGCRVANLTRQLYPPFQY